MTAVDPFRVKLMPFQDRFVFSQARFPAFVAGWGTGKTLCGLIRILKRCHEYPNNLALVCRKSFTDLRDSSIKDFEFYTGMSVNSDGDVVLPNGSRIMFRHAEQLDKLKNINLGACMIEQAEEFDDDSQWFYLFGRMRRRDCGSPTLFIVANTNGPNWVKRLWKDNPAPGYELHEATTFDNRENLPKEYLGTLETLSTQKPSLYDQFVMNTWNITSGKIFPMWDEKFHVIPDHEFPSTYERFGVIDTAVASGVFCALVFVITPEDQLIAIKEYYAKERLISEHCKGIKDLTLGEDISHWIFDPSAFNKTREKVGKLYSVANELHDHDIYGMPAENAVDAGINRLGEYLKVDLSKTHPYKNVQGSPQLFVTESCLNTRREVPSYREVPNRITKRGDMKWVPYKRDDHSVDVLRYAVMSRPSFGDELNQNPLPRFCAARSIKLFEDQARQQADDIYWSNL
jgi:phage terminase large subunit